MCRSRVVCVGLVWIFAGSAAGQSARHEARIRNVEQGLVEIDLSKVPFYFQSEHKGPTRTLAERMAHYKVPGVSIAVIDGFEVAWSNGYGVTEVGGGMPVTRETHFEAGSISKVVTSIIALKLVEQGRLDLDEDVNLKLTSWRVPTTELTRNEKVTLRRLLTHQSGLNRPNGGMGFENGSRPSVLSVLRGEAPALNQAAVVEHVPGSRWQYSNLGFVLLQLLLEDVTKTPFPQLARGMLLARLGLDHSTFTHPLGTAVAANLALPHDEAGKAHRRSQQPYAVAHGGLVTTPTDLARVAVELMRAYQGRSDRILSAGSVRRMFTPALELPPDRMGVYAKQGLGVMLEGQADTLLFLFAGSNAPGSVGLLVASPATGKGAVIMANGAQGELLQLEILPAVMNEYGWPLAR